MATDALRILLYSATPRSHPGGVQHVVERLLAFLRARGHSVFESWASPDPRGNGDAWVQPLRLRDGSRGLLGPITALGGLHAGLRRRRPEIVNIHFVTGQSLYFLLLSRVLGYVTILSAHGGDILRPSEGARRLLPFVLRHADAITVVSDDLRQRVLALGGVDPARVHVIANGVDHAFWSDRPRAPSNPPNILAVGRLEAVKGFDVLLRAFARVRQTMPSATLTISGSGAQEPQLRALAASLGVQAQLTLTGRLGPREVRERLSGAAVFALSSLSEGMPLALIEAMAAGAPIVATTVGGAAEALGAAGLLCPPGDEIALADSLLQMLRDPAQAERLGKAAQQRARSYSVEACQAAYETLYADLLAERRHQSSRARAA